MYYRRFHGCRSLSRCFLTFFSGPVSWPHMAFLRLRRARRGGALRRPPSATKVGTQQQVSLEVLARFCGLYTLPVPVEEFRFHPERRWRFDFAYPDVKIGIEIEGGVWSGGRHTRGKGFILDCEKYNEAQILGWKVLRFTPSQVLSGIAFATIKRAISTDISQAVIRELRAESRLGEHVSGALQDAVLPKNDAARPVRARPWTKGVPRKNHGPAYPAGAGAL